MELRAEMLEEICASVIGTIVGVLALVAAWYFCDWWFDHRAIDKDWPG
jgi:hypothetical protein